MTVNVDLLAGGDAHKRFDLYPSDGETLLAKVLRLNDADTLGPQRAAERALALPSAEGMPSPLRNALTRLAKGSEKPEPPADVRRPVARRSRNAD